MSPVLREWPPTSGDGCRTKMRLHCESSNLSDSDLVIDSSSDAEDEPPLSPARSSTSPLPETLSTSSGRPVRVLDRYGRLLPNGRIWLWHGIVESGPFDEVPEEELEDAEAELSAREVLGC